jgi:hypothetical protein
MSVTTVLRTVGKTFALSVTSSSHAAVLIDDTTNDQVNYAAFINTGTSAIAVKWGRADPGAAVLPVDGTPADFVLPASMTQPVVLAVPQTPYYLTAISASATGIIYVTPVGDQS